MHIVEHVCTFKLRHTVHGLGYFQQLLPLEAYQLFTLENRQGLMHIQLKVFSSPLKK